MNKMELKELREQCEMGLEVRYVVEDPKTNCTLVVLEGKTPIMSIPVYHCHRYFNIGGTWVQSYDAQNVYMEIVWKWLKDPKAI